MDVTLIRGKTVLQPVLLEAIVSPIAEKGSAKAEVIPHYRELRIVPPIGKENAKAAGSVKTTRNAEVTDRVEPEAPDSWRDKTFDYNIKVEVTILNSVRFSGQFFGVRYFSFCV